MVPLKNYLRFNHIFHSMENQHKLIYLNLKIYNKYVQSNSSLNSLYVSNVIYILIGV